MPEWLSVIILGIVEGLTEFLPISSTGHLILTTNILQFDSMGGVFEIFIQIGAVVAIIFYYRNELIAQLQNLTSNRKKKRQNARQLWLGILIAFIPAAIIGLLLGDTISDLLFNPTSVAIGLIVGGIMFIVVERFLKDKQQETKTIHEDPLTLKQSLLIGLWQLLALIPGMSRSGMSIIGGMVSGLDRQRSTEFSFYLAMPTLGAATLYTLVRNLSVISNDDLVFLMIGAIVSGIVAWFSVDWLLRYVATNNFIPFGYYRIIVGIIILIVVLQ